MTRLLHAWREGDESAPEQLIPLVYDELRLLASRYLRRERSGHTLQATALVHEAYLQLVDQTRVTWKDRAHFAGVAARLMRRILVDHARNGNRQKRGGQWEKVYLDETRELSGETAPDLVAVDEVLQEFARSYPREGSVVEMKFFAGMEAKEIAQALNVSLRTVMRDWSFAKAWLSRELTQSLA
ncbi:MAG TPA: sigma-70 family RNA polymerase sigma factor [Candidatus Binataceae bacterium]|nr:sigma-70 family RNA polymerase sigma factor [Candidatus Binataceae bacterium]